MATAQAPGGLPAAHSIEAEESVLGAILLVDSSIYGIVIEQALKPEDFYREQHRIVFRAMVELYNEAQPIDTLTLVEHLRRTGRLEEVGGEAFIHRLAGPVPYAGNAPYYAQIVKDNALLRRLMTTTYEIQQRVANRESTPRELVEQAERAMLEVAHDDRQKDFRWIHDILDVELEKLQKLSKDGTALTGTPTGFKDLDGLTGGFQPGNLIVIAARPAMGKCLAGSALVYDPVSGARRRIDELVSAGDRGEEVWVASLDSSLRLRRTRASAVIRSGVQPAYRLTTRLGRRVEATASHPLLTSKGWRSLGELKRGDRVAVPRRLPPRLDGSATPDHEIVMLAALIADGNLTNRTPRFCCGRGSPVVEEVARALAPSSRTAERALLDTVPEAWDQIVAAKGERTRRELSLATGRPANHNGHMGTREMSRPLLQEIASRSGDPRSDVWWDEVASVEYVGERETYDLTVPDDHNFVADDLIVHNSALVTNIAENVALDHHRAVALFSLEMSETELAQRFIASQARIKGDDLRKGRVADSKWPKILEASSRLANAPLYVDDSSDIGLLEIRAKSRRLHQREPLGMVIVDYLQLLRADGRIENRVEQVGQMSRGLKILARELDVPVVALSQLNRSVEARTDKRPLLSDLRESGCLAGDARVYLPASDSCRPIRELVGLSGFDVLALNRATSRLEACPVTNAFSTGVKPVNRLTTRLGRRIRATANHKFLTDGGWRRLDELRPGTRIALPWRARTAPASSVEARIAAGAGVAAVRSAGASNELAGLATSDVYWDQVASIEPDGVEEVFDLTVDRLHNFVAEDIVVHNSIEQDSDVVMFIYRDEYYNKDSEDEGIAELIVSKHRNGPIDTVRLTFQKDYPKFMNYAGQRFEA